ncbi:Uma2 family endonuclease [Thermosynechococcus sp.]|uniref:Uma2 family endonuclease n=1 Tax=Thermosynechococcus sp. TaxID=2814275 RepID=UPI00391A4533
MITSAIQPISAPQPVRFTVQDYHRLLELGFLRKDDPIELIRGELVRMAAKETAHESCLRRLLRILPRIVGDRATLQGQSPITIALDSEPEPDVAIVKNREDDSASAHSTPADTLLVIEVAALSLEYDRTVKLSLYAEAKIPHYWLFNVSDRTLEVHSEPAEITPQQFGYLSKRIVPAKGVVQLPQFPKQVLEIASIFPSGS